MGFEPTTTEFRSDALIDWAIRPWVQLAFSTNFVELLQFHCLFSVYHFGYCLLQLPCLFWLKFSWGNHMSVVEWTDMYGIYHWMIIWSIESWHELKSKQTIRISNFNVQTLNRTAKLNELVYNAQKFNISIITIQEHWLIHEEPLKNQFRW